MVSEKFIRMWFKWKVVYFNKWNIFGIQVIPKIIGYCGLIVNKLIVT